MKFDWGSAAEGAIEGGSQGAMTGNPWAALAAALVKGGIRGFQGKKEGGADPGMSIPGMGGGEGGGFEKDIIGMAIKSFLGGAGGGEEEAPAEPQPKVFGSEGRSSVIPPTLMGFPSLNRAGVGERLRGAVAGRRGY